MIKVDDLRGIDLSHHNPVNVVERMRKFGFAVIKGSEGVGYKDPMFKQHVEACKRQGMSVGLYHFVRADTGNTPQAEMDNFQSAFNQVEVDFLALDVEAESLNVKNIEVWLNECVRILKNVGVPILIYVQASAVKKFQFLCNNYPNVWIWLADWSSTSIESSASKYGFSAANVAVWQEGSTNVDGNLVDFNEAVEGKLFTMAAEPQSTDNGELTLAGFIKEMRGLLEKYKGVI